MFELEFVQPLLTEFGSGKEVLAIGNLPEGVAAMTLLTPNGNGTWEVFQRSQAPVGMWLARPELDTEALLHGLLRSLPGLALVVGVPQCDPYLYPRPAATATLQTSDYVNTARITIHGSFDEYWNARGKNLRANLKKQRARLLKEGIAVRMEISRQPEEMAAALADYGRLESAGWKGQGGTAIHPDNAQGRFYLSMLEGFCRRGAGSVLRYWFNDQLVAMNLCIEGHASLIVLKTTYDESVPGHYSPAFLMREETCRQMFNDGKLATLEFYGKVMEWHLRWTDEVRTLYHMNSYRWPILLHLRSMVKNLPGRPRAAHDTVPVALASSEPDNNVKDNHAS